MTEEEQTAQHRAAYRAVMEVMPGSELIEHKKEWGLWVLFQVRMPFPPRCETCGDRQDSKGLTAKCRNWHAVTS